MLNADPAEPGMVVERHVARGEDPRHAGLERWADHDPVAHLDGRTGRHLDVGLHSHPHHDEIALDGATRGGGRALHPLAALEPLHGVVEMHAHPVIAVDRLDDPTELRSQHPIQRSLEDLHYRDVAAELLERRRHLRADESHPHDQGLPPGPGGLPNLFGLAHRAQVEHAGQAGSLHRQPAVPRAGGQQRQIERNPLAAGQHDLAPIGVDPVGPSSGAKFDAVVRVPLLWPDHHPLEAELTPQELLGQRRPLVGRQVLLADHDHAAVESLVLERGGRGAGGNATAHDDDGLRQTETWTSSPSIRTS